MKHISELSKEIIQERKYRRQMIRVDGKGGMRVLVMILVEVVGLTGLEPVTTRL